MPGGQTQEQALASSRLGKLQARVHLGTHEQLANENTSPIGQD